MTATMSGKYLSVALTEEQVRARFKRETRRLGWWLDKNGRRLVHPGDHLRLARKVMGRRPGEPIVVLAEVCVTEVRREPLDAITLGSVVDEGFPEWGPDEFVAFFCREMRCEPDREVTVIRWRYTQVLCPECDNQFDGRMPGHVYGSNWSWVPCQTCSGAGFVPLEVAVAR